MADQSSVRRRRRQRAEKVAYVRRFFVLCCGELADFSAPPAPSDASALDVFKAALSAGQSNGVVCAFSRMKEG